MKYYCSFTKKRAKTCFLVSQMLYFWKWETGLWSLLPLVQPWVGDGREFSRDLGKRLTHCHISPFWAIVDQFSCPKPV